MALSGKYTSYAIYVLLEVIRKTLVWKDMRGRESEVGQLETALVAKTLFTFVTCESRTDQNTPESA